METIYDYVEEQEKKYSKDITLEDGWDWNMKEHLRRSFLYKNSQFLEQNDNRTLRPNKNIVLGILNVQYRTEGFDVKDIALFVDDPEENYKSFLVKKFHDKWALDNQIDTFIDELVESYCDYGGALVRNAGEKKPEVVDLRTIAFCNQRDFLNNPFAIKRVYSQDELKKTKKQGWGDGDNGATIGIEEFITLTKDQDEDEIEVYEVYGVLPQEYMDEDAQEIDNENEDEMQLHVVAFYKDDNKDLQGHTLYKTRVPDLDKTFKFLKRDDIKGRALGRGGVEELFEAQKWTNWNEITITEMLQSASKTIGITDDPAVAKKHKHGLKNLDNWDLIESKNSPSGKGVWQMDTFPRNLEKFNNSVERWEQHAERVGSATDPLQGETPPSGTPFKLYERQTIEAKGMHNYRRGKIAVFVEEIYREWIIPHIAKEIVKDNSFLAELNFDEMTEVAEQYSKNFAGRVLVDKVLNGQPIIPGEKAMLEAKAREMFVQKSKKFITIIKDEFKGKDIRVNANIAGKQKNLDLLTDKLVGVLRQYFQMQASGIDTSGMDTLLNTILESSGLSPIMFGYKQQQPAPKQANAQAQPRQPQAVSGGQRGNGVPENAVR